MLRWKWLAPHQQPEILHGAIASYSVGVKKEYSSLRLNFDDAKFSAFEDFFPSWSWTNIYLGLRRLFRKTLASPKGWTDRVSVCLGLLGYPNGHFNENEHSFVNVICKRSVDSGVSLSTAATESSLGVRGWNFTSVVGESESHVWNVWGAFSTLFQRNEGYLLDATEVER